jgi:hypothetical protein
MFILKTLLIFEFLLTLVQTSHFARYSSLQLLFHSVKLKNKDGMMVDIFYTLSSHKNF